MTLSLTPPPLLPPPRPPSPPFPPPPPLQILADFNATGKKGGLQRNELLAGVYPTTKEWSPSNGCLTATSKLVPKTVWKTEKDLLDVLKKEGTR